MQSPECHVPPLPSHFDKNCFLLAAADNFDNADKNSLSRRMHGHDTALTLLQEQPDNHIQKPSKDSLDLTNAPNLNKLLVRKFIPSILLKSFHSVTDFKPKMGCIWTRHLKMNLRNVSSLSAAPKV